MPDRRKPAKLSLICCVSLLALCLAVVTLASCRSSTKIPPIDSSTVQTIHIYDFWSGYAPESPVSAAFHLEPAADCFAGTAEFSVGGGAVDLITRSVPITVPLAAIDEFLALLESTPLEEEKYEPSILYTDSYPTMSIAVQTRAGHLWFYSESQGDKRTPWQVTVPGAGVLVTHAGAPADALSVLEPYLAREAQKELIKRATNR